MYGIKLAWQSRMLRVCSSGTLLLMCWTHSTGSRVIHSQTRGLHILLWAPKYIPNKAALDRFSRNLGTTPNFWAPEGLNETGSILNTRKYWCYRAEFSHPGDLEATICSPQSWIVSTMNELTYDLFFHGAENVLYSGHSSWTLGHDLMSCYSIFAIVIICSVSISACVCVCVCVCSLSIYRLTHVLRLKCSEQVTVFPLMNFAI
jgi:hypothetical protein